MVGVVSVVGVVFVAVITTGLCLIDIRLTPSIWEGAMRLYELTPPALNQKSGRPLLCLFDLKPTQPEDRVLRVGNSHVSQDTIKF